MYRPPKGQSRLSIKTSVFSSLLGGRLHRRSHCRGAAHKLNLRRTTTRGKHEKYIATLDTGIIYDRL